MNDQLISNIDISVNQFEFIRDVVQQSTKLLTNILMRAEMESALGIDLAKLVRVWRSIIDQRLKPLGLTQTLWVTLHNISQLPPEQSQIQLAKAIGIEQPSLVRTLDQLEHKGLILRTTCADDRRAKRISLSEKAQPIIAQLEKVIIDSRKEVLQGLSPGELETLSHLIRRLEQNVSDMSNEN